MPGHVNSFSFHELWVTVGSFPFSYKPASVDVHGGQREGKQTAYDGYTAGDMRKGILIHYYKWQPPNAKLFIKKSGSDLA